MNGPQELRWGRHRQLLLDIRNKKQRNALCTDAAQDFAVPQRSLRARARLPRTSGSVHEISPRRDRGPRRRARQPLAADLRQERSAEFAAGQPIPPLLHAGPFRARVRPIRWAHSSVGRAARLLISGSKVRALVRPPSKSKTSRDFREVDPKPQNAGVYVRVRPIGHSRVLDALWRTPSGAIPKMNSSREAASPSWEPAARASRVASSRRCLSFCFISKFRIGVDSIDGRWKTKPRVRSPPRSRSHSSDFPRSVRTVHQPTPNSRQGGRPPCRLITWHR